MWGALARGLLYPPQLPPLIQDVAWQGRTRSLASIWRGNVGAPAQQPECWAKADVAPALAQIFRFELYSGRPATESGGGLSGHSAIRIRFRCVLVIVSFLYALGRTLLFCINRAPFGVAKRAGQYVAELAANLPNTWHMAVQVQPRGMSAAGGS
jgi:hypothetical protein